MAYGALIMEGTDNARRIVEHLEYALYPPPEAVEAGCGDDGRGLGESE